MDLKLQHYIGIGIAIIIAAPAAAAGGGLIIAGAAILFVLALAFGAGPAWELYNNKRIGERGRFDPREVITPGDEGFDVERQDRGGNN